MFEDETFVLGFNEREASGNTGEHSPHAAPDDLPESFEKRQFLLIERGVVRDGENDARRVSSLQLKGGVIDKKFVAWI